MHRQLRRIRSTVIDPLRRSLKVSFLRVIDIDKLLRIAIDEREPRTLHLDHDPAAAHEGVIDVGHRELDLRYMSRHHCFRF